MAEIVSDEDIAHAAAVEAELERMIEKWPHAGVSEREEDRL